MSPTLEWAIHTTGQHWKDKADNERVELDVFDLQKLKKTPGMVIFHISDVLQFLEKRNKAHIIDAELQQWARNCDKYVTVGPLTNHGLVRSIPWEDLCRMPILSDTFFSAYTLDIYCKWRAERKGFHDNVERDEVCLRVLESARIVAGRDHRDFERVAEMVVPILGPGIDFWGIETDTSDSDVGIRCTELLEEDWVRQKLQDLSVSKEGRRKDHSLGNK